ncbi:hypothetical protein PWG14_17855 (plasmid) [Chromobacterium amazonense]|uniref:hypothetical protein n=1 Tax=Chromobacterium amazonense TaxID=1382803 RepID=UPI00237ECB09|nr:hypothetical protein [Chromobacterium amazonense]MDE1714380.1 hypothetical protein [Chromobacterium amazonense]
MSATKSLHVLIDRGMHKRLKVAAASLDKTIVEIVSEALIFQMAKGEIVKKRDPVADEKALLVRIPEPVYELLDRTCELSNGTNTTEKLGKVDYVTAALATWLNEKAG